MFKNKDGTLSGKKISITVIILVLASVLVLQAFVVVPPGHTGVVVTLGRVEEGVLQEGMSVKTPFVQQVVIMNNQVQKLDVTTEAFSNDLQTISAVLAVNYRIDKGMSHDVYKNVGFSYESVLLIPAVNEVLKAVVANYSASELVEDRSAVSVELNEDITTRLTGSGIIIESINIIDWDFSEEYIVAIEQKQVAEQNLIKTRTEQEQAVVIANAEAEKQLIAANAAAEAAVIAANAEAQQISIQAEAQSTANELLAASLTEVLINYETIEKWDGKLPTVQTGEGGTLVGLDIPIGE